MQKKMRKYSNEKWKWPSQRKIMWLLVKPAFSSHSTMPWHIPRWLETSSSDGCDWSSLIHTHDAVLVFACAEHMLRFHTDSFVNSYDDILLQGNPAWEILVTGRLGSIWTQCRLQIDRPQMFHWMPMASGRRFFECICMSRCCAGHEVASSPVYRQWLQMRTPGIHLHTMVLAATATSTWNNNSMLGSQSSIKTKRFWQ